MDEQLQELIEELKAAVIADMSPEDRIMAFASAWTRTAQDFALSAQRSEGFSAERASAVSITYMLITTLQAAARHPEWLMAVVRDIEKNESEKERENKEYAFLELISMYPMPVMRDERG